MDESERIGECVVKPIDNILDISEAELCDCCRPKLIAALMKLGGM